MQLSKFSIRKNKSLLIAVCLILLFGGFVLYNRVKNYYLNEAVIYSYIRPTAPHSEEQLIVRFKRPFNPFYLKKEIDRRENSLKALVTVEDGWNTITGKPNPEKTLEEINSSLQKIGVSSYRKLDKDDIEELNSSFILYFGDEVNIEDIQIQLQELGYFEISEPDFFMEIFATPNDQYYPQLWGMEQVQAPDAWDLATGDNSITVGVIDSGSEQTHPDLAANIIEGYNFLTGGPIQDGNGHGTHVAGTIGAVGDNSIGVVGVNWNVSLMPLQVFDASGRVNSSIPMYEALSFAVANGAKVINMSLGNKNGYVPCNSSSEYARRIGYAVSQGVTVVVAAGNETRDASAVSPASCDDAITVGATTKSDGRASFSNFGSVVDIGAPGVNIESTWRNASYKDNSGTSMASPMVAGAAALLLSANPSLTPQQVRDCLVQNGDSISTDRPIGGVRLNVYKALQACSNATPREINTPTPTLPPGVTPTATPTFPPGTPTPTPTLPPGTTPTNTPTPPPVGGNPTPTPTQSAFLPPGTPTPTPEQYFTCQPDPNCISGGRTIQLCPLVCSPN